VGGGDGWRAVGGLEIHTWRRDIDGRYLLFEFARHWEFDHQSVAVFVVVVVVVVVAVALVVLKPGLACSVAATR
jgi:hypothetical protein